MLNQEELERVCPGATLIPIILASDETKLSTFSGDKVAYPLYITIGNIEKDIRRKPSQHATVLLAYLPAPDLANCLSDDFCSDQYSQLFHTCMSHILHSLIAAGTHGTVMLCPDGRKRHIFPILGAYVADYPEQCKVACCRQNRCPAGDVEPKERGDLSACITRDPVLVTQTIRKACEGQPEAIDAVKEQGLRTPFPPFWSALPHANIFTCFTPDLLHQLRKGVFKDHLVNWVNKLMAEGEMDRRFQSLPPHPSLRHFHKGITLISQWTGKEYKQMERVFMGVISGGTETDDVCKAARAVLDFIYLAQLPVHTTTSLADLARALRDFHRYKVAFVRGNVRDHFNIPKIHAISHYPSLIASHGTTDGYNTESPERLHIEFAKKPYQASNKRDYMRQMARWTERTDSIAAFEGYIDWFGEQDGVAAPQRAQDMEDDTLEIDEEDTAGEVRVERFGHQETFYYFAARPSFPNLLIPTIIQHFKTPRLLGLINGLLHDHALRHPGTRAARLTEHDTLRVYRRVSLQVRPHNGVLAPFTDVFRATPSKHRDISQTLGGNAHFDPVLLLNNPGTCGAVASQSEYHS